MTTDTQKFEPTSVQDAAENSSEAEFSLLSVLADIRQKTGVGQKPMLSDLADVLAEKCIPTSDSEHCLGIALKRISELEIRLKKAASHIEKARYLLRKGRNDKAEALNQLGKASQALAAIDGGKHE